MAGYRMRRATLPSAIGVLVALAAILFFFRSEKSTRVAPPVPAKTATRAANSPGEATPSGEPSGHGPRHYEFPEHPDPPSYPPPKFDPRIERTDDGKVHITTAIARANLLNDPKTETIDDLESLDTVLRQYRWVFKQNPVGDNADIVAQLSGANPMNIVVLPPDHSSINAAGELLDRFGNPYFFHANSESSMDIWSLGPDGQLGTIDDVRLFEQIGSGEPDESGD